MSERGDGGGINSINSKRSNNILTFMRDKCCTPPPQRGLLNPKGVTTLLASLHTLRILGCTCGYVAAVGVAGRAIARHRTAPLTSHQSPHKALKCKQTVTSLIHSLIPNPYSLISPVLSFLIRNYFSSWMHAKKENVFLFCSIFFQFFLISTDL